MSTATMPSETIVNPAKASTSSEISVYAVMAFLFMCAAAYHFVIFGYNLRYSPIEDNWFTAAIMGIVLIPLAFLERPSGIMLVNSIRLKDHPIIVLFWVIVVGAIGVLALSVTLNSHETMTEQRDNRVSSHSSSLTTLDRREKAAQSTLDTAVLAADSMSPVRAKRYLRAAQLQYDRTMIRISEARTEQFNNAPTAQKHEGSFEWLSAKVFSAMIAVGLSVGAIIVTIYEQLHVRSNQRVPAFSLSPKLNQEWEAFKGNFKAGDFHVDPSRGLFNGMFLHVKKNVTTPAKATENQQSSHSDGDVYAQCIDCGDVATWSSKGALENRKSKDGNPLTCDACDELYHPIEIPEVDALRKMGKQKNGQWNKPTSHSLGKEMTIACPECDRTWGVDAALLKSIHAHDHKAVKCSDCGEVFNGILSIEKQKVLRENQKPDGTLQNSSKPQIRDEFPANSSEIHLEKQGLNPPANSGGIPDEFATNLVGISGGANSGELMPKNSTNDRQVDLSKVAQIDGTDAKLKALSETIDTLSSEQVSDGLLFSPTKAFKTLQISYPPVQKVFKQKQQEGKISLTKPYRIIYRPVVG